MELRSRGVAVNVIADQLGVTPSAASKIIKRALAALVADTDELAERRELMQMRIDQQRFATNQVLARDHPVLYQGEPVRVARTDPETGEVIETRTLDDDGIKLAALDRLRALDRSEAELWGLDAAKKFEHTGQGGGPVEHEMRVAALMERTASITLMPPAAIDVESVESERKEA